MEARMAARLVFLSGSKTGTTLELGQADVSIGRRPDRTVAFSADDVIVSTEHASVLYRNGRYLVRDDGSRNGTFVNSEMVKEHDLQHGDLIQFGPGGPTARFVLEAKPGTVATVDIASMAERRGAEVAARSQAGALTTRDLVAVSHHRLSSRFRTGFLTLLVLIIIAVGGVLFMQQRNESRFERDLAELSAAVTASRSTTEQSMAGLEARYAVLRDAVASGGKGLGRPSRVSLDAAGALSRGVVLIAFAYGYTRPNDSNLLRYVLDSQGKVATTRGADGRPIPSVGFDAAGPPVQRYGTATGFLVDSGGYVLTNGWVTAPWASAPELSVMRARGLSLEGHMIELRAYLPPGDRWLPLFVHRKSDDADVAVVRLVGKASGTPTLDLAPDSALVRPGDQLLAIGYPANAEDLLFRVDSTERNAMLGRVGGDTWRLVEELGRRRLIQPVITDGAVKTTTPTDLTHTAGTAVGGSGWPLLDAHQQVVAIQRGGETPGAVRISYAWEILPSRLQRSLGRER
jgi:S1-C subfamily serine protease